MKKLVVLAIAFVGLAQQIQAQAPADSDSVVVVENTVAQVKGSIVDNAGQPVAGAVVKVESTGAEVTTGTDGSFALENVAVGENLLISKDGFKPATVAVVKDQEEYKVTLEPATPAAGEDKELVSSKLTAE